MSNSHFKSSLLHNTLKPTTNPVPHLGNLELVKTLSQGTSYIIKLGRDIVTKREYAVKIVKSDGLSLSANTLEQEATIHLALCKDHPNILQLYKYIPNTSANEPQTLIMEPEQEKNLFECIQSFGPFSEQNARTYFEHLLNGVEHIHSNGFLHMNLRPENLVFSKDFYLKIKDFSFSVPINKEALLHPKLPKAINYSAPELLTKEKQDQRGFASDLFSCGVVLFTMVAGYPPFNQATTQDSYYNLIAKKHFAAFWKQHERNRVFDESFKSLINSMLSVEPTERLTVAEIRCHSWLSGKKASLVDVKEEFEKISTKEKMIKEEKKVFTNGVQVQKNCPGPFAMHGIKVLRN